MTSSAWVTDAELGILAQRLGEKIVEMYAKAEIGSVGGFGPNYDGTIIESVILDAMDFASLDPQKIIDESERMRLVASALRGDQQVNADLDQASTVLAAGWTGEAADRFHDQMRFIRAFLEDHAVLVEKAFLALGMAFAASVRVRLNFQELANATIAACEQEMAAQETRDAEADTKRATSMVNGVLDLFGKNPAGLIEGGIRTATNVGATELEISLKASGAPQVVEAYTRGRDSMHRDFEDAMAQVAGFMDRETAAMGKQGVRLLQPLPSSYDPSSPDFRYEVFASGYRPPVEFGPRVERRRVVSARSNPDSAVRQRLDPL